MFCLGYDTQSFPYEMVYVIQMIEEEKKAESWAFALTAEAPLVNLKIERNGPQREYEYEPTTISFENHYCYYFESL